MCSFVSAEKLRPEKELDRAKKEILRRKVKIRDLIQHLDTLCAEGNIPESLFNSHGEISSEAVRPNIHSETRVLCLSRKYLLIGAVV